MASTPREIILQLQREYRSIINQLLSPTELALLKSADLTQKRTLVADFIADESSKVRVPGGSISAFEERLNRIAHQVFIFWTQNGEKLNSALREMAGFKLATTVSSLDTPEFALNVRRLCVYFDTLTIVCPVHEGKSRLESRYGPREHKDFDEIRAKLHIAVSLVTVILSEPLLSADTAMPMIVVVPDTYACRDDCETIDTSSGRLLLEHLIGGGFKIPNLVVTQAEFLLISSRYKNHPHFKAVFDELLANEYADYLPPELRINELRNAPFQTRLSQFLANVGEAATEFNILSTCAEATASDPIVVKHKQRTFRGYLETSAKLVYQRSEFSKESAIVAQGLLANPNPWF